ncbi:MAG TPA: cation diffusion facilitator family transporter [Pseudomonadota bacterium]|nr:cation diffusion facilitator family transporter [Pseudomonadota bacterium]
MARAHDHQDGHGHDHAAHDHVGHEHHGGHGHVHAPASFGKAFAVGIALNAGFVVLEVVYGLLSNSVALLADAGHNMSDVFGLGVAWAAAVLAKRAPTQRFTYGLGGTSILAALFNASFLLVIIGGLSWEAIGRFWDPQPVAGKTVMIVAAIGILINGVCAWLFASGRKGDLNIRGAFTHMAADALVSVGVVIAGLVILLTGWLWLDPAVSLIINAIIIWGTWGLLRDSVTMSLNAVPSGLQSREVDAFLSAASGVQDIHDLHIWSMSTTETALTAHLVMPGGHPGDAFLVDLSEKLKERFGIGHATFQVETDPHMACPLEPDHVV